MLYDLRARLAPCAPRSGPSISFKDPGRLRGFIKVTEKALRFLKSPSSRFAKFSDSHLRLYAHITAFKLQSQVLATGMLHSPLVALTSGISWTFARETFEIIPKKLNSHQNFTRCNSSQSTPSQLPINSIFVLTFHSPAPLTLAPFAVVCSFACCNSFVVSLPSLHISTPMHQIQSDAGNVSGRARQCERNIRDFCRKIHLRKSRLKTRHF